MTAEQVISKLNDPSQKQLVFFYELCKAGVIKFDFNNPEHAALFGRMGDMMRDNINRGIDSQIRKRGNLAIYRMIVFQLLNRTVEQYWKG